MEIQRQLLSLDENGKKLKKLDNILPEIGGEESLQHPLIRLTSRVPNSQHLFDDGDDKMNNKRKS
jgi:hypothetical protein